MGATALAPGPPSMLSKNGSSKPAQRDALDDNTDTVYDVIILGGDDAGLGAVWAASQLELKTLLVVQHRAEIGGDFVQIATDLSVYPPTIGGWNMVYDGYARRTCNHPAGGTHQSTRTAPPGANIKWSATTTTWPACPHACGIRLACCSSSPLC